ncbi:MAG: cadherin repeat domain-containing protein [Gammaproteobacteria bacterium]|jgi:hypothetical protein|nr:cadherin repeat domain-containing protein [Gammaproteobacteria bacterium]
MFGKCSLALMLLVVSACGGSGGASPKNPQNTAPDLVAPIEYAVDENVLAVATFEATDAQGDAIVYSVSGSDAALFDIGSASGALAFTSAPDYDNPRDIDRDNIYSVTVSASDGQITSSVTITVTVNEVVENLGGLKMLLIGNSFFRPYAQKIRALAVDANFLSHSDVGVFRGGDNGRPLNLWEDTGTSNARIKEVLDQGGVDVFGMTGAFTPDNPTGGYAQWISYALQENPDISVFISIPQIDFPTDWQETAQDSGFEDIDGLYDAFVTDYINNTVIDALRAEFPDNRIFSIPTGLASLKLRQMYDDNLLLDDISFIGPAETALFTDQKGHQGEIIITTGTLIWLTSLYLDSLEGNDFDTGFNTDLHQVAQDIMNSYDPYYGQP